MCQEFESEGLADKKICLREEGGGHTVRKSTSWVAHSCDWQGDAGCWLEASGLLRVGLSTGHSWFPPQRAIEEASAEAATPVMT